MDYFHSAQFGKFVIAFVAFFVAMDTIGILPIYLSMTHDLRPAERKKAVNQSILVGLGVALVFVFMGHSVFKFLGITLQDFKIAGGIVLILIALADLVGRQEAVQRASGSTGIVPLGVPLITGPATLTTIIVQVSIIGYWLTLLALVLNFILTWVILGNSGQITRAIGKDGTVVFSKLAALFLAAIAVAMIRSGIVETISDLMIK